jgi:hypothetical protein
MNTILILFFNTKKRRGIMTDYSTKAVAHYVKNKGIQIKVLAKGTGISVNVLYRALNDEARSLRADEFLAVCGFIEKDPIEFMKKKEKSELIELQIC